MSYSSVYYVTINECASFEMLKDPVPVLTYSINSFLFRTTASVPLEPAPPHGRPAPDPVAVGLV